MLLKRNWNLIQIMRGRSRMKKMMSEEGGREKRKNERLL
jgi:hypothetical protein